MEPQQLLSFIIQLGRIDWLMDKLLNYNNKSVYTLHPYLLYSSTFTAQTAFTLTRTLILCFCFHIHIYSCRCTAVASPLLPYNWICIGSYIVLHIEKHCFWLHHSVKNWIIHITWQRWGQMAGTKYQLTIWCKIHKCNKKRSNKMEEGLN